MSLVQKGISSHFALHVCNAQTCRPQSHQPVGLLGGGFPQTVKDLSKMGNPPLLNQEKHISGFPESASFLLNARHFFKQFPTGGKRRPFLLSQAATSFFCLSFLPLAFRKLCLALCR